jgi:DNA-binding transcriptional ArsR family regulator
MAALGREACLLLDAQDVGKVKVRPTLGPLSESLFSLRLLSKRPGHPLVRTWRRAVRGQVDGWEAPLRALAPISPVIDLHTVVGEVTDIEQALKVLSTSPVAQLRAELAPLRWGTTTTDSATWARVWLRDVSQGDPHALEALTGLLRRYYRQAVEPYWETIRSHVEGEQAHRSRIMAQGGVDQLLDTLHPRVRWRRPYLDVGRSPASSEAPSVEVLGGRSLVLVPSVFCLDGPQVLRTSGDEASPYLLVYPALREASDAESLWTPPSAPKGAALARLLGSTRAGALQMLPAACTTTQLARQLQVSPATASHHIGVLRAARLITSTRRGTEVAHHLTPLGAALLGGVGHGS